MNRRLYRCRQDRRLAGVAAGVAEFFGLDPTLVRVLWFLSIFF
jgi:phage shock protein C